MLDGSVLRVSIVAPYFFLIRDGISARDFPKGPTFEGVMLFANNYTVQGVKIKSCKPILNRVHSLLSRLEISLVNECPFLKKKGEIYIVDLSFIPEKYRLDVKYAEEILQKSLQQWLMAVKEKA
jgi:ATP-dependent Lon protease